MQRLSGNQLSKIRFAFPPFQEQVGIANFLDREIAKVDALIHEQKRLMELLAEKRQAVISSAVTKGLDSNAPLRESGVEWIGLVPQNWSVRTIRSVAQLESGHTPSRSKPEWWVDCNTPWFTLADVWQIREAKLNYVEETSECVSELGLQNSSARRLPANTVILSRTASVGYSAIMRVPMATSQDFANWICGDQLLPEYLLLALRSMTQEFRRLMMGSTHNTIYMPDIRSLRIPLPEISEQRQIVKHVESEVAKIDALMSEVDRSTHLMKERRVSVISAAVTGKIDVRGFAASQP